MAGISVLIWTILFTSRIGLSRILVTYALGTRDSLAANEAVRLSYSDSETHYARALLLRNAGFAGEAADELHKAVAFRPRDYVLWLELGITREELGDPAGAESAMNEAVRLAPYYAVSRWQRGNLLLRMRRYDEGFADLRMAARSNPELTTSLVDLAWGFSQSDAAIAQQLAEINSPTMHATFALYLARRGRAKESVEQFGQAGDVSEDIKRDIVAALLERGAINEAYLIWAGASASPSVHNGGFEAQLSLEEYGFSWRVSRRTQGAQLSLDSESPHEGQQSLRIDFNGESDPQTPVLTQLMVVEPNKTYQLVFVERAKGLVTGGVPAISVFDAGDKKLLAKSPGLGKQSGWNLQTVDFISRPSTKAVLVTLQRENCSTSPCPAFGTLWLDSFELTRIAAPSLNNTN